jgi:acetyl esterase/lipase
MATQALFKTGRLIGAALGHAPKLAVNAAAGFQPHKPLFNLAYGPQPRQRLDVYVPRRDDGPFPVIVYLYGGSWSSGAKEIYRFLGADLAARGFLAVIPDYRVYPAVRYPGFVEDAAQSLRWAKEHAHRFGADPDRIFVMGHSAGAHIAAMLAFERRWLAAAGFPGEDALSGVIGLAGPYDFEIDSDLLRGVFGDPENKRHTQPLAHVNADGPPVLLATGEADKTVDPRHTRALAAAIRAAGGSVETIFYPRLGHREIVGAFSPLFRFLAPVAEDVAAFVSTQPARTANTVGACGNGRGRHERI